MDGAVVGDLFADALEQDTAVLAAGVLGPELLEGLGLGGVEELEEDVGVEAEMAVEVTGLAVAIAAADEGVLNGGFEVEF